MTTNKKLAKGKTNTSDFYASRIDEICQRHAVPESQQGMVSLAVQLCKIGQSPIAEIDGFDRLPVTTRMAIGELLENRESVIL